jgi:hypothetical protein
MYVRRICPAAGVKQPFEQVTCTFRQELFRLLARPPPGESPAPQLTNPILAWSVYTFANTTRLRLAGFPSKRGCAATLISTQAEARAVSRVAVRRQRPSYCCALKRSRTSRTIAKQRRVDLLAADWSTSQAVPLTVRQGSA